MAATIFCGECGRPNVGDARYCNGCGAPVVAAAVAPPPDLVPGGVFEEAIVPERPRTGLRPLSVASPVRTDQPLSTTWIAPDRADAPVESDEMVEPAGQEAGPRLLWWTIPAGSLLHLRSFRALMTMRIATETALNALTYGMLIEVVQRTQSGFQAALVTVSTVAPAALFGLLGGAAVDRANKRWMLVITNLVRAVICFAFLFTARDVTSIYVLLVAVTIATQFATPAESAIVPRVVPPARLAGANSFANLAESAGQLLGMAVLAPIFVKLAPDATPLILVCGGIFAYAGVRAVAIRTDLVTAEEARPALARSGGRPWLAGTRESLGEAWTYLAGNRPAFVTMMLLVLAATANLVMVTLAPRFTQQVLDLSPEFAVFVFGPAVTGMLAGLAFVPRVVHRVRARVLVLAGFLLMVVSLLMLGAVNGITEMLYSLNPLNLYDDGPLGRGPLAHSDGRLGTAMLLAIPLGFSFSVVQVAANTFLHERIPLAMQGRVFALQGAVKNATAIIPLLALGGLAQLVGVRPVLIIAPLLILFLALYGAAKSAQWAARSSAPPPPAPAPAD